MAETYSLRQVVELTGLSEFTLRGWENRYQAFKPRRNATGRRRYSLGDLQKALRLRDLVERGHRIGLIAGLPVAQLDGLLAVGPLPVPVREAAAAGDVLRLLELQNWDDLEDLLLKQLRKMKPLPALREFIIPLLQVLASKVAHGEISIAQEHVFSALLRKRLYGLSDRPVVKKAKIKFVIAAPEGDHHELGLLVAHALMTAHGLRSLYIGPNCPKEDLCEAALRFGASHVLLGSTISRSEGAKEELMTYLNFLHRQLPRKVALWIGGRHGAGVRLGCGRNAEVFSSLLEFDQQLSLLSSP